MDEQASNGSLPPSLVSDLQSPPTNCVSLPTKGTPDVGTLSLALALTDTRHLNSKPADTLAEERDMLGDAIYVASDFPVAYQASQNSQQRSERMVMTYQERVTERVNERAAPRPFNPDEIDRGFVQHGMCF